MRLKVLRECLTVILVVTGVEVSAATENHRPTAAETEVPAVYHPAGPTDRPAGATLPPELARFSAVLGGSEEGAATPAGDETGAGRKQSLPIFVTMDTRHTGICRSAPVILESAQDIASAPLLEMVSVNFKGWRESTGELVDLARSLKTKCKNASPDIIDGQFVRVKKQFEKLLSMRR